MQKPVVDPPEYEVRLVLMLPVEEDTRSTRFLHLHAGTSSATIKQLMPQPSQAERHRLPLSGRQRAEIALLELGTLVEALAVLLCARACVRFCFRRIAGWALQVRPGHAAVPHRHLEARIGRSIGRAAKLLPGTSLCLPQAIAGKWMLGRRGFPATIHLGVGHKDDRKRLHAHAWLEAGGLTITGAGGIGAVTPLPR